MKYFKSLIAYISLGYIIYFVYMYFTEDLKIFERKYLVYILIIPLILLYNKYKPFKLTGDLDLRIKMIFANYLESQKSCPNCDRVVKASELTQDGKCIYCKELEEKER